LTHLTGRIFIFFVQIVFISFKQVFRQGLRFAIPGIEFKQSRNFSGFVFVNIWKEFFMATTTIGNTPNRSTNPNHPANPGTGNSSSVKYNSNEPVRADNRNQALWWVLGAVVALALVVFFVMRNRTADNAAAQRSTVSDTTTTTTMAPATTDSAAGTAGVNGAAGSNGTTTMGTTGPNTNMNAAPVDSNTNGTSTVPVDSNSAAPSDSAPATNNQ
jgi:hypothetical protein